MFSRDLANSERRVARGEFPLYLPFSLQNYNNLKGLPIKPIVPAEGRPYVRFDLTMLKNAPHPNAARVFMNHYLEPELQLVFANAGYAPVVKGVVEKSLEEIRVLLATKALGTTIPRAPGRNARARQPDLQVGPDAQRLAERGRPPLRRGEGSRWHCSDDRAR